MDDLISRAEVLKILSNKNAAWDAYTIVKSLPPAINLKMRLIEYIEARDDAMYTKGGIIDLIKNFK